MVGFLGRSIPRLETVNINHEYQAWILFIAAWLIGDLITTIIGLELGLSESSQTIKFILDHAGYPGLTITKLAGAGVLYAVYRGIHHWTRVIPLVTLGVWALVAVVWNTMQITLYLIYA